jgi:hypothetical protein
MIPLMMLGLAALLFTMTLISLQIASAGNQSILVRLGLILVFLVNVGVSGLLVMGAIGSSL